MTPHLQTPKLHSGLQNAASHHPISTIPRTLSHPVHTITTVGTSHAKRVPHEIQLQILKEVVRLNHSYGKPAMWEIDDSVSFTYLFELEGNARKDLCNVRLSGLHWTQAALTLLFHRITISCYSLITSSRTLEASKYRPDIARLVRVVQINAPTRSGRMESAIVKQVKERWKAWLLSQGLEESAYKDQFALWREHVLLPLLQERSDKCTEALVDALMSDLGTFTPNSRLIVASEQHPQNFKQPFCVTQRFAEADLTPFEPFEKMRLFSSRDKGTVYLFVETLRKKLPPSVRGVHMLSRPMQRKIGSTYAALQKLPFLTQPPEFAYLDGTTEHVDSDEAPQVQLTLAPTLIKALQSLKLLHIEFCAIWPCDSKIWFEDLFAKLEAPQLEQISIVGGEISAATIIRLIDPRLPALRKVRLIHVEAVPKEGAWYKVFADVKDHCREVGTGPRFYMQLRLRLIYWRQDGELNDLEDLIEIDDWFERFWLCDEGNRESMVKEAMDTLDSQYLHDAGLTGDHPDGDESN